MFITSHNLVDIKVYWIIFQYSDNCLTNRLKVVFRSLICIPPANLLRKDAVTIRNGSKFSLLLIGLFIHNQSHSVYKSCAFASPGHNCSQPLEHWNKKQLTKETHYVSETGLAKINKQFLSELYGHSKRIFGCLLQAYKTFQYTHFSSSHPPSVQKGFY